MTAEDKETARKYPWQYYVVYIYTAVDRTTGQRLGQGTSTTWMRLRKKLAGPEDMKLVMDIIAEGVETMEHDAANIVVTNFVLTDEPRRPAAPWERAPSKPKRAASELSPPTRA